MSLNDRQHVEAVAIMRRLVESYPDIATDQEAADAAVIWLKENHPSPEIYMAALRAKAEGVA